MSDAEKIKRLEAQVAALQARIDAPHNYVLVPGSSATPEPDFEYCAEVATEATGLPSQYRNPWLSIFIREIRRWAAHQAFHQGTKSPWKALAEIPNGFVGDIVLKARTGEHSISHTDLLLSASDGLDQYIGWMPLPSIDQPIETVLPVTAEQVLVACYAYKPTYGRDTAEDRRAQELRMREALDAAFGGLQHRALQATSAAAAAVYFDDGHDFKEALHKVVDHLFPKFGSMLREDPAKAYRVLNPSSEAGESHTTE